MDIKPTVTALTGVLFFPMAPDEQLNETLYFPEVEDKTHYVAHTTLIGLKKHIQNTQRRWYPYTYVTINQSSVAIDYSVQTPKDTVAIKRPFSISIKEEKQKALFPLDKLFRSH